VNANADNEAEAESGSCTEAEVELEHAFSPIANGGVDVEALAMRSIAPASEEAAGAVGATPWRRRRRKKLLDQLVKHVHYSQKQTHEKGITQIIAPLKTYRYYCRHYRERRTITDFSFLV
jgi:membrane carboxypeptidase/penicillin-binding protein